MSSEGPSSSSGRVQPEGLLRLTRPGPMQYIVLTPNAAFVLASTQEQSQKSRVRGVEAHKQNIQAAKSVAKTLRSSLGPKVRATLRAAPNHLAPENLFPSGGQPPRLKELRALQ